MELLDKTKGPLLGGVVENRIFAVNYMGSHGFEVKEDTLSKLSKCVYYLRGELVGWSYDNVLYLLPVMPSLVDMGILAQRRKIEIGFDMPSVEVHRRLREAVNELKNSSDSYDELVKGARAQKVREYFKRRERRWTARESS